MPLASKAFRIRRRNSRPTSHCFNGSVLMRNRSVTSDALNAIGVVVVADADVDHVVRKVLRLVRQRANFAGRNVVQRAFEIAQHDRAEVDRFNGAADVVDVDDVTEANLVFGNHE